MRTSLQVTGRRAAWRRPFCGGRRARRGMTLAEVLIAAVLLGFVVMSSLTALSQSYGFIRHARMVTLASQIMQSLMEDLRLRNFSQLITYAGQAQPVNFTSILSSERFESVFTTGFTVSGVFTTVVASNPSQPGKISVELTVNWTENRVPFTRKSVTYFGEQGLSDYIYVGWAP
jgi:Tfp pilus assembly protein PilV